MPLDAIAAAYAGLLCLALATRRFRHLTLLPQAATSRTLRAAGGLLIALSFLMSAARLGVAIGIVAWIAALGIAAVALVLLLSRSPKAAFWAAPPMALAGLIASLV